MTVDKETCSSNDKFASREFIDLDIFQITWLEAMIVVNSFSFELDWWNNVTSWVDLLN